MASKNTAIKPEELRKNLEKILSAGSLTADNARAVGRLLAQAPGGRSSLEQAVAGWQSGAGKNRVAAALGLWLLGRMDAALELLPAGSSDPAALQARGLILLKEARYPGAAAALEKARERGGQGDELLIDAAEALVRVGRAEAAAGLVKQLSRDGRKGARGLAVIGLLAESDGDYEAARDAYHKAVKADPADGEALFRLAYHLDLRGEDDEAMALYEKAVALKPTYINAVMNLGVLYEDRGDYQRAIDCFRSVLEFNPRHVRARMFLKDSMSSLALLSTEGGEKKEDDRSKLLSTPISEFELSVRSRNCLARMNIKDLGDLVKRNETELLAYKNFGETSLNEIKSMLEAKGLRLGLGAEPPPLEPEAPADAAAPAAAPVEEAPAEEKPVVAAPAPEPEAEPEVEDIRGRPIGALGLSVRSRKCLDRLNVETVSDLVGKTEKDLLGISFFGDSVLREIKDRLQEYGLSLREAD